MSEKPDVGFGARLLVIEMSIRALIEQASSTDPELRGRIKGSVEVRRPSGGASLCRSPAPSLCCWRWRASPTPWRPSRAEALNQRAECRGPCTRSILSPPDERPRPSSDVAGSPSDDVKGLTAYSLRKRFRKAAGFPSAPRTFPEGRRVPRNWPSSE